MRGESREPDGERSGSSRGVRRSTTAAEASTIFDVAVQGAVLYYASGESVKGMPATATLECAKIRATASKALLEGDGSVNFDARREPAQPRSRRNSCAAKSATCSLGFDRAMSSWSSR